MKIEIVIVNTEDHETLDADVELIAPIGSVIVISDREETFFLCAAKQEIPNPGDRFKGEGSVKIVVIQTTGGKGFDTCKINHRWFEKYL